MGRSLRRRWRKRETKRAEAERKEPNVPPSYEVRGMSSIGSILSALALSTALISLIIKSGGEWEVLGSVASALMAGGALLLFEGGGAKVEEVAPFINRLRGLQCWAFIKRPATAVAECDGWIVCLSEGAGVLTLHVISSVGLLPEKVRFLFSPVSVKKSFSHLYKGEQIGLLYSHMRGEQYVRNLEMWRGEVKVASPQRKGVVLHGNTYGYTARLNAKSSEKTEIMKLAAGLANSMF